MSIEKKRILIVDDLPAHTRLVKSCLEQTNDYLVREENNALAALGAAEEFEPDLILLDLMMPKMDGFDLADCFRASPKLNAVPIVFLTATLSKREAEAGRGYIGSIPCLAKPIVLSELVDCLKLHLDASSPASKSVKAS
jgi:CheY-like chemotaxis protein